MEEQLATLTDVNPEDATGVKRPATDDRDGNSRPAEEVGTSRATIHAGVSETEDSSSDRADRALLENLPQPPESPELAKLRELLFAREITLLERLKAHVLGPTYTARKVSSVLTEALLLRSNKDASLNAALEPLVDEILKTSLRKHQTEFVNVLFPLMGPSIRKSIAETFRSMLGSFSKSLEMAFSWKGLRWRLEAMRSGKSFSEIVLLHTLVYRVEQAFFIHSETGLVLSHLVNEGVGSQDADMVSAMLTAIQDFARDCFSGGASGELESLRLGEFTILLEKSPQAYLACVVRGTPPAEFHEKMRSMLELMLVEYADSLAGYNGDTEPFSNSIRYLDELMLSRYVEDANRTPLWAKVLPVVLILLALGGVGFLKYRGMELEYQKNTSLNLLRAQPGLMVINVNDDGPPWQLTALKDALTDMPDEILRRNGMDPDKFSFKIVPFISYDPAVVEKRATIGLKPLDTVQMEYDGAGTLVFKGTAPMLWIVQAREYARSLPGVEHVDMSALHDPLLENISTKIREIESVSIEFPSGKSEPVPSDAPKLAKAVDTLVELEQLAQQMGFSMSLTIYGHADTVGNDKRNYEISSERTRTVASMLYAKGSSIPVAMYGMGSKYPKAQAEETGQTPPRRSDQSSRRIEMRVHLVRSATSDMDWFR